MAMCAAAVLDPGVYFAINVPSGVLGETLPVVSATIGHWGFRVTPEQLQALANSMGEASIVGRTGGAPSLAVGMATIFGSAFGQGLTALWYHFAILFEALFILTTLDAGTRVGRFMIQELGAHFWKPLGRTSWYPATIISSLLAVTGWGWFLIQGVLDPYGGINSLWPLFGISNQLLAAVALSVGTTLIIKSGKARYAWTTLLPLAWVLVVTFTAGYLKIFSADPRLGMLAHAEATAAKIAAGTFDPVVGGRMIFNDRLDSVVALFFLTVTFLVVAAAAREWVGLLRGSVPMRTTETPFVESAFAD
jgi:carbon starvation protein